MKKIIGIVLALCMLFTMASAATITDVVGPDEAVTPTEGEATMSVSITYAGLDSTAQATMLAYKVADSATADSIPAFVDTETTPIVGIDQSAADGTFDFQVASTFRGKVAVMIGGTDVATPVSMLVEFKDATVDPGTGEEGGDDTEYVEVTVICGDVDGDDKVTSADAGFIMSYTIGGGASAGGDYAIGSVITTVSEVDIVCGDVDGDGKVTSADAGFIMSYTIGGGASAGGSYLIGGDITFNVPKA